MKKNIVRLTEAQLHQVIKESVKRVINEIGDKENSKMQKSIAKLLNKTDKEEDPQHSNPTWGKKGQAIYDHVKKTNGGKFPKGIEKRLK